MINNNSSQKKKCYLCNDMLDITDRGILNFTFRLKKVEFLNTMKKFTLLSVCGCNEYIHRICFIKKLCADHEFKCFKCDKSYKIDLILEETSLFNKLSYTNNLTTVAFIILGILIFIGLIILIAFLKFSKPYEFWKIVIYVIFGLFISLLILTLFLLANSLEDERCIRNIVFQTELTKEKTSTTGRILLDKRSSVLFNTLVSNSLEAIVQKSTMKSLMSFLQHKMGFEQHETTVVKLESDMNKGLAVKKDFTALFELRPIDSIAADIQDKELLLKLNSKRKISDTRYFMKILNMKNKIKLLNSNMFELKQNLPLKQSKTSEDMQINNKLALNEDKEKGKGKGKGKEKEGKEKEPQPKETIIINPSELEHPHQNIDFNSNAKILVDEKQIIVEETHIKSQKGGNSGKTQVSLSQKKSNDINPEADSNNKTKEILTLNPNPNTTDTTNINTFFNNTKTINNIESINKCSTENKLVREDYKGLSDYKMINNRDLVMNFYSEESEIALNSERSKALLLNISDSSISIKNNDSSIKKIHG